MKYNFDEIIDRKKYYSVKWTNAREYGEDVLPMWIADMDFKVADEILEALRLPIDHGVLGYNYRPEPFYEAIRNWVRERHDWEIEKEWIVFSPGVVPGISVAIDALSREGEGVIIQPPVYPPFYRVIENLKRRTIENPLLWDGTSHRMDLKDLEKKIDKDTKIALICSPHNPVGRVWKKEELEDFGRLCLEKDIFIISDEIHSDFAFKGKKHLHLASLSRELAMNTITFLAPSKSFNIAGLHASVAIIPNETIRNKYIEIAELREMTSTNIFSVEGFQAAYKYGANWLDQALDYIEKNADFAVDYIKNNIAEVEVYKPDGTFLLWLDFRKLGMSAEEINRLLIEKGRILLNDGSEYGKEGQGYFRFNIGCPRKLVEEGLVRIERALNPNV